MNFLQQSLPFYLSMKDSYKIKLMKITLLLLISILSFNAFGASITCTFDDEWKKLVIDTEAKTMALKVFRISEGLFENKLFISDAVIDIKSDSVTVYETEKKEKVLGQIELKQDRVVEVSTFLYKNKKFPTSEHDGLDQFFDFAF